MSTYKSKQRIKWKIKFYPAERKSSDKNEYLSRKIPIYMWVTFGKNQRLQFYTKEQINADQWDSGYLNKVKVDRDHFRPIKPSVKDSVEINDRLEDLAKETRRLIEFAKNSVPPIDLTPEYLREELKRWINPDPKHKNVKGVLISEAMDAYKEYLTLNMAPKTASGFNQVRYNIEGYIDTQKNNYIYLPDVNQEFVNGFEKFLITKTGKHNKKLSHNTYCKNLKILRSFLLWCTIKKQWFEGDVKISYKENDSEILFLKLEEINKLEITTFEDKTLERIRDVFVFGCFTGLRYGDIKKLKKTDLRDGRIYYFEQKKNATTSKSIMLVKRSMAIVEKYKSWPGEMLLPTYANPNQRLKEVFKAAGIDESITIVKKYAGGRTEEITVKRWEKATTHMERKTFITLAITSKMPIAVLKSITGHVKDSKAFQRYYEIDEVHKDKAMEEAFGSL